MHTMFNNNNFRLQGLQVRGFQQCNFKCKCETPYLDGELVPKTWKEKKCAPKKFLSGLVTRLENLFVFGKTQIYVFKQSCWPISLWLKHLKAVVRSGKCQNSHVYVSKIFYFFYFFISFIVMNFWTWSSGRVEDKMSVIHAN